MEIIPLMLAITLMINRQIDFCLKERLSDTFDGPMFLVTQFVASADILFKYTAGLIRRKMVIGFALGIGLSQE
jgi:hypothetical protein